VSQSPSRFIAVCPNCLVRLKVNYAFSGHMVRCKFCEHKFEALAPDLPPEPAHGVSEADLSKLDALLAENGRMSVVCPSCSTYLRVRSVHSGHHVRCGHCQEKFLIPKIVPSRKYRKSATGITSLAEQLKGRLGELRAGPPSNGDAPAGPGSETDEVRGVLSRLLAEFRVLEEECARLRSERRTIGSRYKRLRGKYEYRKLELQKARSEHQGVGTKLATFREALGDLSAEDVARLKAERESLPQDRDRSDAELAQLREARDALQSQRDGIQEQLARLQAEHDQLRFEQDLALQEHHRQGAELAGLIGALGALSPDDIGPLREERDSLRAEASLLREQVQALEGELSAAAGVAELVARRDDEIRSARALGEHLEARLQQLETALDDSRAGRARLDQELQRAVDELETARSQSARTLEQIHRHDEASQSAHAELQGLADQIRQREDELAAARAELDRLADQIRRRDEELGTSRAGLERQAVQLQAALDEAGRLSSRDQELAASRAEQDGLADQLRSREDELAASRAEIERQADELSAARAEIDRQAAELRAATDDSGRLRADLAALEHDSRQQSHRHDEASQSDRARLEELAAQLGSRDDELDAARAEIQRLTEQLGSRDDELTTGRAEMQRQADELAAARSEMQRQADELAAGGAEIQRQAAQLQAALGEAGRLRADLAALEHDSQASRRDHGIQIESLQRTLDQAQQRHRVERNQLTEQIRSMRDEIDSAESRRKALEARVVELQDTVRTLKSEKSSLVVPDDPETTTPPHPGSSARRFLNEDAMVEALMDIRLGGRETVRPAGRQEDGGIPLVLPQASQEAEVEQARRDEESRKEIETLRKKLAEKEAYVNSMASLLASMGIKPSRM
jgi:chromosome segregation ATPase